MNPLKEAAKALFRARGHYRADFNGQTVLCDPYNIGFWRRVESGEWEPHTFGVLDRFLRPNGSYCDIGAWIGPTVLYAATRCQRVVCFEPDRFAFERLLTNLRLNRFRHVSAVHAALSDRTKVVEMGSFGSTLGDSESSLLASDSGNTVSALTLSWNTWWQAAGRPSFDLVKMDVEGSEFSLLPAMKTFFEEVRPALYLSTHAPLLPEHERRARLEAVTEQFRGWTCHDEGMNRLDLDELQSAATETGFRTFVLTANR